MIARALTIAGSDPSGGAGIQQDLRTFAMLGVWGSSAITAITVQDSLRVHSWEAVAPNVVRAQIDAVLDDVAPDAIKTGMLGTSDNVVAVAGALRDHPRVVVDPVAVATVGASLASEGAMGTLRRELLPRALVVTPNADEARALTGIAIESRSTMSDAARALLATGIGAAYVKGGHAGSAVDLLATADRELWLDGYPYVDAGPVHGTGCVLSAALTAFLADGASLEDAAIGAKDVVARAFDERLEIGRGATMLFPRPEVEG